MIEKAKEFARKAHDGQFRKGTTRPYITHCNEVAEIVASMTDDEEVISAAYLHDTIEDCKDITKEIIEEEFSSRVAELVMQESEDKSKTWYERKNHTVCHLKEACPEVKMIALADKLANMGDIDRDYGECGEELWKRFRMKEKKIIGWYYKGVREALAEDYKGVPAYEKYCQLVNKYFE